MSNIDHLGHRKHGNGFMAGFLLGFLVGAVVVFLFATKKGKKIMEIAMNEGMDKVSKIENAVEEYMGDEYDEEMEVEAAGIQTEEAIESAVKKATRPVRRFFRKASHKN